MKKYLNITNRDWRYGSYYRDNFRGDCLYTCFFYKDIRFTLDGASMTVHDACADRLRAEGVCTTSSMEVYEERLWDFFEKIECYDEWSLEQIYAGIHTIRKHSVGAGVLEEAYKRQAEKVKTMGTWTAINQAEQKIRLLNASESVLFVLSDPSYFSYMEEDIKTTANLGINRYVLTGAAVGDPLPGMYSMKALLEESGEISFLKSGGSGTINLSKISYDEKFQEHVEKGEACLLIYGEDGFFHCRNLKVPTVIQAVPSCYYAKALAGVWEDDGFCTIYVPPNFDLIPHVRLTEKSRLTYAHLAYLCNRYGTEIYHLSIEELYCSYPQVFLNIYGAGGGAREDVASFPMQLKHGIGDSKDWYGDFCRLKEGVVASYIGEQEGMRYLSTYFDDVLKQTEIPWGATEKQGGILVQGIVISRAEKSQVMISDACAQSPRTLIRNERGFQVIANFLFFLTPKLVAHYNYLRKERPWEQIQVDGGHLDYMLRNENGTRVESFPLYRKACIALKKDGGFLFCHYELGGGSITINQTAIFWTKEDVNPVCGSGAVVVYTPCGTNDLIREASENYKKVVGEGRVNIVIIQQNIVCLRVGAVMLPSIGVVLSLEKEMGESLLQKWNKKPSNATMKEKEHDPHGYYDCSNLRFNLLLDPPEEVLPEEWNQVIWAFGGGMSLIKGGISLFEAKERDRWLETEGWLSPLSRQTQESEIHKVEKHPRTAVGITEKGELFVLVFSGRTAISAGADYVEMSRIARKLIPSVKEMMNVDGGGSSVLGIAEANDFMELSYPATSYNSCAGMARKNNTILCLKQ